MQLTREDHRLCQWCVERARSGAAILACKGKVREGVAISAMETHCSAWGDALAASEVQIAELWEAMHGVESDPGTFCGNQRPH